MRARLSSWVDSAERFLDRAGLDRGPWLALAFASGIGLWFALDTPWQWLAVICTGLLAALAALASWRDRDNRARLLIATVSLALAMSAGTSLVWARSVAVGAEAIAYPMLLPLDGRIVAREEQPAQERVRLVLAVRDAALGRAMKVRVNVPLAKDLPEAREGARVRLKARLMPPAPPILPGAYDFARAAWFDGLAATGSLSGEIELIERTPQQGGFLATVQRNLSAHVRRQLDGSSGAIAAAFASGDRGAIDRRDDYAMRDAGLTHLLSISGLHVSAVIAASWVLAMRLLALWPWLVLRVRLPLLAGAIAAGSGVFYTLLTGAEVPTVRSCLGALLVLVALALGREPLSMRMVAVVAVIVLALWPEALVGPSFQMSFAAVIAIVALHGADPVKRFLAAREESWLSRTLRRVAMLFLTGVVIELALTPIVLFHFHRAGLYGAFANVVAIPLVTFVAMPLIALALLFDLVGAGAPFWWLTGQALDGLLGIAHFTAAQPGSVKLVPQMGLGTLMFFLIGSFWLALWRGRARLMGLVPIALAAVMMAVTPAPDLLVTRDGRDVGIAGEDGRLFVLRPNGSEYARENLQEMAGLGGQSIPIADWPGARCSLDFCVIDLPRGDRRWIVLLARSKNRIDERALAAACERADIVVAGRWLPQSCRPMWLKADRALFEREGGLSVYLEQKHIETVAEGQGEHGWWREPEPYAPRRQ